MFYGVFEENEVQEVRLIVDLRREVIIFRLTFWSVRTFSAHVRDED